MSRLRAIWETLRSSLWFIPSLIVVGAIGLAAMLIELDLDTNTQQWPMPWPRVFATSLEGARSMLAAIASSMITVAGVTFSITIVVLALGSSQYTSRILRNFMRDRTNQTVLGVFVGVFVYCLVVLRSLRSGQEEFVPAMAVLAAVLLAIVAIGFFVLFIHHISVSIQAANIIDRIACETLNTIDRLYPDAFDAPGPDQPRMPEACVWTALSAHKSGYIEGVDIEMLGRLARKHALIIRMDKAIGEFTIAGDTIASAAGAEQMADALQQEAIAAYTISRQRTLHQDAGFGIRQIVDVALKALSPGINDTTTAINCIDFLGAILARLVQRRVEMPVGEHGGLFISCGPDFDNLLGEAFCQIRENAAGNTAVLVRMLHSLEAVARHATDSSRLSALQQQVRLIVETAERSIPSAHDRIRVLGAAQQFSSLV
jgi:uncharacterized membrane protein